MFRLFLVDLVRSGKDQSHISNHLPPKRLRNRRIYERFDMDRKHLSLMNEQDIFVIRDLSERGFSTEVSTRGFARLLRGDIYTCRIRYLGEIYATKSRVIWKSKGFVGFELVAPDKRLKKFMSRLIKPLAIGTSLQKLEEKFAMIHEHEGMSWYRGDNSTNVFIWTDETGELQAWRLETDQLMIRWSPLIGLQTGRLTQMTQELSIPWKKEIQADTTLNPRLSQYAIDIFMATDLAEREFIVSSIEDPSYGV